MKKLKAKVITARNPKEIAEVLGLSNSDFILMEYKTQLSSLAVRVIKDSGLSVNEIVNRSGVARSKVSAIKNGSLSLISTDLFLKVITGCGSKIRFKLVA